MYLRTLSRPFLHLLAEHGCAYLYTGIESASSEILEAIGKPHLNRKVALEWLAWLRDEGLSAGISLMFGSMTTDGMFLETEEAVAETVALAGAITCAGVVVVGFYPNVLTVLPGTALARGLADADHELDFCQVPRCEPFDVLEDGGFGYNFLPLGSTREERGKQAVAERIVQATFEVQGLGAERWSGTRSPG